MKNLIALVAIAMGAYIVYTKNADGLDPMDLAKSAAGILGGSAFFVMNNFAAFKNGVVGKLSQLKMPSMPKISTVSVQPSVTTATTQVVDQSPVDGRLPPNAFELNDHIALTHLRNRLAKAKNHEGVELCTKLATIIFTLDIPEDDATVDNVADALTPDNVKAADVKQKITV